MERIRRISRRLDHYQQRHPFLAFPLAVVKRYSEDSASNQVALITYYGLLSLFPLMLATLTIIQRVFHANSSIKAHITALAFRYVPIIGNELQHNLHTLRGHRLGVTIALLVALYGSLGVANAIQNALNHLWSVERVDRSSFPHNLYRNFAIVFAGGGLMLGISAMSNYLGHLDDLGLIAHGLVVLVTFAAYFLVFLMVFRLATSHVVATKNFILSAAFAALGWQVLQVVGGYLIVHELHKLSSFYGTFAIFIGLLFWIAIQAQVTLLAVEIDVVRTRQLWPRTFLTAKLTEKDEDVYRSYVKRERRQHYENISVSYPDKD
ncbi:MAG TPA: YihY/virulence factor BrkB family protein [Candidatus Saccharimonadales bacterium]|nr:YihY/virulence factor BrkB family protein [Candidatus Saccharimonadales bacterium]